MGILACKSSDARRRTQPGGTTNLQATQTRLRAGRRGWYAACLILWVTQASADSIRIATFAAPLSRDGPGLLHRDLGRENPQITAVQEIIAATAPDILLLTDFDYDLDGVALDAFAKTLAARGVDFPYLFALPPNTGLMTGHDLDQNGKLGEARDAQGYGRFAGDGGMALLSRWPIVTDGVRDLSAVLWKDLPGATLPIAADGTLWPDEVTAVQRLSTTGHWIVPITLWDGLEVTIMAYAATPPVFDGPEDRNGLRNRDELGLWSAALNGHFGAVPASFVVMGNANLDPVDGQGDSAAMAAFLGDPRLIDPRPMSVGAKLAGDDTHSGDPALDTADWSDDGPGNLRVSYVLPSSDWRVTGSGVFWPAPDDDEVILLGEDGLAAGPHRLVWVDIAR